jgi:CRP/FNR family transcriptional regulator, cyclic AMP receptor protein
MVVGLIEGARESILGRCLSPENLEILVSAAEPVDLRAGQVLFREGDFHPWIYVVLSGTVDLVMTVPGRGPCRILSLGQGDLVAWSSVLGEARMTCDAVCTLDSRSLQWSRDRLVDLCQTHPQLGYEFMSMMATALSKRLTATRLQLLDLFRAP